MHTPSLPQRLALWLLGGSGLVFPSIATAQPFSARSSDAGIELATEAGEPFHGQDIPPDGQRPNHSQGSVLVPGTPLRLHPPATWTPAQLGQLSDTLRALYFTLTGSLQLPDPAPDSGLGGDLATDFYWVQQGPEFRTVVDSLEYGAAWDRASAYVLIRSELQGNVLLRALSEGLVQAILLGIDARPSWAWRTALAATIAGRATGLGLDPDAVASFQEHPERGFFHPSSQQEARGAGLFTEYLAARYDTPDLRLLRGLAWAPVARTPEHWAFFADEPDPMDVLKRLLRDEPQGLQGALQDFARVRMLLGTEDDPWKLMAQDEDGRRWAGLLPAVSKALDHARLPAWVTPPVPLEEGGCAYVALRLDGRPDEAVHAWFHGVPWSRWTVDVLRLARDGRLVGEVPRSNVLRGEWSIALESLSGVQTVMFVLQHLGNGDFDPDDPPTRKGFFALNLQR